MPLRLPPLATLRIFESAARLRSFKLAAAELGLTPSAVSHGIDTLEKWLEVRLFERGQRAVALTAAGQQYVPYISEGLSMVAVGTQRVASGPDLRRVAVSVAPSFAECWLVPRLAGFRSQHPDISVIIDTSHRQALFPLDGVDVAIRRGKGPWPGTRSELLFTETIVPVGSKETCERLRRRNGGVDWARATLLTVNSVEQDWSAWFEAKGIEPPKISASIQFDVINLALDAAAAGLGLALGRAPLLERHPAAARLIPIGGPPVPIETGYWLTTPGGQEPRREIRAFQRWLMREARREFDAQAGAQFPAP